LNALAGAHDVALLFLDLDRFKVVNDTLGHSAGDSLLLEVGVRLTKAVRSTDLVARVGGDEFVVLCMDISAVAAAALARRIRQDLAVAFNIAGQSFFSGASIGVAHTDSTESSKLLDAADAAMYVDKRHGKDRTLALATPLAPAVEDSP
jgi:diguanylate cyclase (GGDEF)-like protein